MKEVKQNKKPMIFYYLIILVVIILFNILVTPLFERKIIEVDYGTFIQMTEDKLISEVQIEDNRILFADLEDKVYETGVLEDEDTFAALSSTLADIFNVEKTKIGNSILNKLK